MVSTIGSHPVLSGSSSNLGQQIKQQRRLLNLQFVDLTDCVSLEDSGLKIMVETCPQLIYIFLRRCYNITGEENAINVS